MKKAALILLIFIVPVAAIIFVVFYTRLTAVKSPPPAAISIWGVYDAKAFQDATATYHNSHPYATITYTQKTREGLKDAAVEAWALGKGPDILMIPADEIRVYQPFLTPAPVSTTSYAYTRTKQLGIKEQTTIKKQLVAGPTATSIRQDFVDAVSSDGIIDGKIYGLPVSMDSLLLYSNRTLLNQGHVAYPAKTWSELVQHVPSLTLFDSKQNIIQSGAALGTEKNVTHAEDILSLLILQNGGSVMSGKSVTLDQSPTNSQAVDFYTDFGNPNKAVYSWNDQLQDSISAFAEGKVAYYIGYAEDEATIKDRGAGIQYDISAIPQVNLQRSVSVAKYDLLVVAKTTKYPQVTWNLLQYLTGKEGATKILNQTLLTPARKDLVQTLLTNPDSVIQAKVTQALTAVNWYSGTNIDRARSIMQDLINTVRTNTKSSTDAVTTAAQQLRLINK